MARTHTFKGSASAGYGYAAFIEDGQLVITEDWGREGGVLYRGPYQHAQIVMSQLRANAPKLANSIDAYYFDEAKKIYNNPDAITYRFKDSRDSRGNGYSGYIENGQLVLEYDDPRNGGTYFRGNYRDAECELRNLKTHDPVLFNDIEKYFTKHGVKDESDLKALGSDEETKTVLFKVKIYNKNGHVHNCLVRGRFQADVIKKLMPKVSEVLTIQTVNADVFAIRSDEISAVEFVEDNYAY